MRLIARGGTLTSTCKAVTGDVLSAPVAILSAEFWTVCSDCMFLLPGPSSMATAYSRIGRIRYLYIRINMVRSAPFPFPAIHFNVDSLRILIPHLFRNFCENFDPMPCEVRSPGQVKWPNYKITFQSRHGYNVWDRVMKLSEYDEVISAYKTYISDFWYLWPQVRSFLRPPHYKSMGKKSTLLYLLWRKRFWVESYRIGQ